MEYKQLKALLFQHECKHPDTHLTAYITFASFGPDNKTEYPWKSRTYLVSSDNKAFQPYHRAVYELHADKLEEISKKYQAGIGYDYDKAVEKCRILL